MKTRALRALLLVTDLGTLGLRDLVRNMLGEGFAPLSSETVWPLRKVKGVKLGACSMACLCGTVARTVSHGTLPIWFWPQVSANSLME